MDSNELKPIPHLIADSAAFLNRANLETLGTRIYSTSNVINELRNRAIRAWLKCLPYTIQLEQPSNESLELVKAMAKKTGDVSALSVTDLGVVALTYDLHKLHVGEPCPRPVVTLPTNLGQQARSAWEKRVQALKTDETTSGGPSDGTDSDDSPDSEEEGEDNEVEDDESKAGAIKADSPSDLPEESEWITEHNFDQRAIDDFGLGDYATRNEYIISGGDARPEVACLTTDFAMQNLLYHLGLQFIGMNGLVIRRPRTRLLWCGACFRPTKRTDVYFCPSCAQACLHRIPVSLTDDGELKFHFSSRYVKSLRGSKQPIKRPRGGKYADEPIYCPDQRLPERRQAKLKHPNVQPVATNGMLDELLSDEAASALEFGDISSAFPLHDVCSRSARVGIRSDHQIHTRSWTGSGAEHGLKPTRGKAHLPTVRTGNKKKKNRSKF